MKKLIAIIIFAASYCSAEVVVNKGKYGSYYHLAYRLEKGNFTTQVPQEHRNPQNRPEKSAYFSEHGQFEVFILKELFPVSSNCKSEYLILRMPGSVSRVDRVVTRKKEVWEAVRAVEKGTLDSVDVFIELNPYVSINEDEFTLEYCNVFFRCYNDGTYIEHLGPVTNEHNQSVQGMSLSRHP